VADLRKTECGSFTYDRVWQYLYHREADLHINRLVELRIVMGAVLRIIPGGQFYV